MRTSALLLLVCSCLLLLAGCQGNASAAVPAANGATPTSTLAPTAPPANQVPSATPTPDVPARCPQLPAAAGAAPMAPLSVYIETATNVLTALNARDGSVRWKADSAAVGGPVSSLVVEQNVVSIVTEQGAVSALNASTGALRWCDLPGRDLFTPNGPPSPALVADEQTVYVTGGSGVVLALNASDGTQRWKQQTQGRAIVLAAADGQVYMSLQDGQTLAALDARTGNERWHFQVDSYGIVSAPALAGGVVYITMDDFSHDPSRLYALRASDGQALWHVQGQGLYFGRPAVVDGVVYEVDTQGVYAYHASNGALVWRTQHGSMANLGPVVADGEVYMAEESSPPGDIFAFRASDGKQQWQSQPGALQLARLAALIQRPASSSTGIRFLAAFGGVVYASHDEVTVALDGGNGKQVWSAAGAAQLMG